MNKLNFTPINQAFVLGSQQIKDTQEEISKLKSLILESEIKKPNGNLQNDKNDKSKAIVPNPGSPDNYTRIGNPDNQTATFYKPVSQYDYNDFDFNLLRIIKHPKFDDVVKNYVLINHPEWLLKETRYNSSNSSNSPGLPGPGLQSPSLPGPSSQTFFGNVSAFGNKYSTTFCSEVKNYVIFFLASLIIYLLLSKFVDAKI